MAGPTPARLCAYRTLRRVSSGGAYADRALRAEAERLGLEGRERALARRLAYGAVQRRLTLNHVIARLADRPLERVDPPLLDALRLGVLQLVYLDSVPDRAAVEQTVELAKLEAPAGAGFANAVMRRAAREARELVKALPEGTPAEAAIRHSHPEWLAELWWEELGREEALALLAHDNTPRETAVRANGLTTSAEELREGLAAEGVAAHTVPDLPEALVLESPFDAAASPLFRAGKLMPQSRASMLVARALAPRPGERVLDLCAAPGAKTTHIAALMGGEGELVAVELDERRARELRETCGRMGCGDLVEVVVADAAEGVREQGFDRVLLDAPCSALGTLQARPDARWRQSPERVLELSFLQERLLDAAAAQVRPGGTLVYSTCTISPEENERQVEALLARVPALAAEDLAAEWPQYAHPRAERFVQTLPHRDHTDGFFIARLRRE